MRQLRFERPPLNLSALDEQLRAELGAAYAGCSLTPALLIVHLHAGGEDDAEKRARRVLREHDPDRLSAAQTRQQQQAQALAAARAEAGRAPDPADYADERLAALVRRVNWLAAEVEALRG